MNLSSSYSKVNVQLLKPGLDYPEKSFKHQDALYYPSKDIVFIATKPSSIQDDDVYTEVAIWEPEQIRLLGTLTLSVPEQGGWIIYIPWHFSFTAIPEVTDIPITVDLFYLAFIMALIQGQFVSLFNASLLDAMHASPFSA